MMKVEADSVICVPPKDIWDVMFDPDFMSQVLPGCKEIERTEENEYQIKMVLGIPGIQGQYAGVLKITQKEPYHKIYAEVQGAGALGKINGKGVVELKDEENHSTRFIFSTEVDIKGPMASMMGGFMEQVADSLVRQSLDTFSQKMEMSKQEIISPAQSENSVKQFTSPTNPSILKMVLNSIWEVTVSKLLRLFRVKR
jgi:carbon monoxide dehydrogenase subunit G